MLKASDPKGSRAWWGGETDLVLPLSGAVSDHLQEQVAVKCSFAAGIDF